MTQEKIKTLCVDKVAYEAVLRNSIKVNDLEAENQQLKEKLEKAEATLLEIDGGWVTDEIRSKISEYFVYAIGEKK